MECFVRNKAQSPAFHRRPVLSRTGSSLLIRSGSAGKRWTAAGDGAVWSRPRLPDPATTRSSCPSLAAPAAACTPSGKEVLQVWGGIFSGCGFSGGGGVRCGA
ncbi:hypothetical protein FKM82_026899 [Ascaphus truei]